MHGGRAALLVAGLLGASAARAEPRARCEAHGAGSRVLVDPSLEGLFEDDQLRLIRLGLVGRVHLELQLIRPRPLWFDEVLDAQSIDLELTWSTEEHQFRMEGRAIDDPRHLALERLVLHGAVRDGSPQSVQLRARLQVVTTGSLTTVAGWMVGGERSRTATSLLGVLADDMTLSASGRCEVAK